MKKMKMKTIILIIALLQGICKADLTLLRKYSHKTLYHLEQMVNDADCILLAKKNVIFTNTETVAFSKKCPVFNVYYYNYIVMEMIKGCGLINGQQIKIKEPFSDLAYTVHYSYYTRGFVIEPFIGEYTPKMSIDSLNVMLVFVNTYKNKGNQEITYQFSILNAYESEEKKKDVVKILNRPPADMKRLFLKHR